MNNELITKLESTSSLAEFNSVFSLPEPYDDSGYYMIYYSEADYRFALPDIVEYIESGMRIYYDRHLESGEAHTQDFCCKAISSHCRCIVFYLSENAFSDPVFHTLIRLVGERNLPSISINLLSDGRLMSGADMAIGKNVDSDVLFYINSVFANEVTFIPFGLPVEEKKRELSNAYERHTMHFTVLDDFAIAEYVKDISEEEVIIPASIEINGIIYPVRAVSARAFSGCRNLVRIVFPDTVEDIGYGCDDESFGGVFENCESLTEIVYPPNVKCLYGGMFNGCTNLRRLILNDGLVFVGNIQNHFDFETARGADLRKNSKKSKKRENDDDESFVNPHTFERLHLPQSAKKVLVTEESVGFSYNSSNNCFVAILAVNELTGGANVSIGKVQNITTLNELYAVANNTEVEEITFAHNFYNREEWGAVFSRCKNLRRVTLPNTIKVLSETFYGCEALEDIILPDSLAEIGTASFDNCKSLKTINIPSHVCYIADTAFHGCHFKTLVCDSKYAYNLFKNGYRTPSEIYITNNRFVRGILKLVLRLLVTFMDRKPKKGLQWWTKIDCIYIKDSIKEFDIEGYIKAESDKPGYRKYECNITLVDRVIFDGKRFGC